MTCWHTEWSARLNQLIKYRQSSIFKKCLDEYQHSSWRCPWLSHCPVFPLSPTHLSSRAPTHLFLNHCAFLPRSWVQKQRVAFLCSSPSGTGWDHPVCLECNFGLKEPELMKEQKQLNPNSFSFHCPTENRGVKEGKLCEFCTVSLLWGLNHGQF